MNGFYRRARRDRDWCFTLLVATHIVAASLAGPPCLAAQQAASRAEATAVTKRITQGLVFQGVTVIDVTDGRLLPDQAVVVTGNRIRAMGPAGKVPIPSGARVVDAKGKYLVPGFWDMHPHVEAVGDDDIGLQDSLYRATYPRFIAYGVTGLREMAQRFPEGADSFRAWQRQVMAGERVGPRAIGPSADLTYNLQLETEDDAVRIIDSLKAAGDAFVKFHDEGMEPDLFFAIAREARRVGLPLVGHVPRSISNMDAADSGMRSIEHVPTHHSCWRWPEPIDTADPDTRRRCAEMAEAYVRNGVWMVPTLPRIHYARRNVPIGQQFVRMMYNFGVRNFLTGTDYFVYDDPMVPHIRGRARTARAGLELLDDVVILRQCGLSPLEALQATTLNPAKFINGTDSLGTVAPGKLADLVLLDANPLADIRNVMTIRAVVANGRYFDRAALDMLDPEGAEVLRARAHLERQLTLTPPAVPELAPLALRDVTVVDVTDGRRLRGQTVVIGGNRVRALGPTGKVPIPPGARVVDARGKYVIPGLWDMHAHVEDADFYRYVARQDSIHRALYPRFLAHGVTGLREMGQRFRHGADSFRVWQRHVAAGRRAGPRVVGPSADVTYGRENGERNYGVRIDRPDNAASVVDSLKAAGDAFVVIDAVDMSPELYYAIARAARRAGLPLVGTAPAGLAAADVADSGQRSIDNVREHHACRADRLPADDAKSAVSAECAEAAKAYIRDSTWLVPMLARARHIDANPAEVQRVVGTLRRLGVTTFLAGTDIGIQAMQDEAKFRPGRSAAEEVVLLGGAGLSALEALQAATLNPAKFFRATDSLGSVAPGKLADLVLLDADPLADIGTVLRPWAVVANGRYFDRALLDRMDPQGDGPAGGADTPAATAPTPRRTSR